MPGLAWPGHGQVAPGAKQMAQVQEPSGPQGHEHREPWSGQWFRLKRHLTLAWPGHGQVLAKPDQATYVWKLWLINY